MGIFGNVSFPNGTVFHNETATDALMNNVCGGILVFLVLIGLAVNMYLIYYYHKHRSSWTNRFYWYLSIMQFAFTFFRGVPTIYCLLDRYPPVTTIQWFDVAHSLLINVSGIAVATIVALMVVVQYCNIHKPIWILVNGPAKLRKVTSIIFVMFWVALIVINIALQYIPHTCFILMNLYPYCFDTTGAVLQLVSLMSLFLTVAGSSCLYIVTVVKFRLNPEYEMSGAIRREFRVVGAVNSVTMMWLICNLFNVVYSFKGDSFRYSDLYVMFVISVVVPVVTAALNGLIMFFSEPGIREKIRCFGRESYQEII